MDKEISIKEIDKLFVENITSSETESIITDNGNTTLTDLSGNQNKFEVKINKDDYCSNQEVKIKRFVLKKEA